MGQGEAEPSCLVRGRHLLYQFIAAMVQVQGTTASTQEAKALTATTIRRGEYFERPIVDVVS